jgi:hypothetical protein
VAEFEDKQFYFEQLASVRSKRNQLTDDSILRQALSDDVLQQINHKIRQKATQDLHYDFWPPLYGWFCCRNSDAIAELDADLMMVAKRLGNGKVSSLMQFLKTKEGKRHGDWYGGLFDLWTKATASLKGTAVELDSPLPNGRESDVCIQLNGRRFHIESTVLTQDDESDQVWRRFLDGKRVDPDKVLIRPGPYCPPKAKGPSPYYESLRFYAKVFDKLTQNLNPAKSQFAENEPNVLLVSCAGMIRQDMPGIGWALDELFRAQPTMARTIVPETFTDISLNAWIDFRARELIQQGKLTVGWYCEHSHEVIAAPRRLGAILLLDGCKLMKARVNYNADESCAVTHNDVVDLEDLFRREVGYWE